MEIQPITNTSREKQGFDGECPGGDNLEEARVQRTRGEHYNILLYTRKKKGDGKSESNATISIPCRMHNRISRRKRRFEITGIHKHEKRDSTRRSKREKSLFRGCQSRALSQLSDREFEDRDPHASERGVQVPGIENLVLCAVL